MEGSGALGAIDGGFLTTGLPTGLTKVPWTWKTFIFSLLYDSAFSFCHTVNVVELSTWGLHTLNYYIFYINIWVLLQIYHLLDFFTYKTLWNLLLAFWTFSITLNSIKCIKFLIRNWNFSIIAIFIIKLLVKTNFMSWASTGPNTKVTAPLPFTKLT